MLFLKEKHLFLHSCLEIKYEFRKSETDDIPLSSKIQRLYNYFKSGLIKFIIAIKHLHQS